MKIVNKDILDDEKKKYRVRDLHVQNKHWAPKMA